MQTSPQTVNGAPVIPALWLSGSPATHSLHDHVKKKKRLTTMKTFRGRFHKQSYQGGNFFLWLSVWPHSFPFTLSLLQKTNRFVVFLLLFCFVYLFFCIWVKWKMLSKSPATAKKKKKNIFSALDRAIFIEFIFLIALLLKSEKCFSVRISTLI